MAFADKLKKMAADYDLAGKAGQAKGKAAQVADKNRDKIAGAVDKAAQVADKKTKGQYSSQINKAQQAAVKGVDKLAEQKTAQAGGVDSAFAKETSPLNDEDAIQRAVGADAPTVDLDPTQRQH